MTKTGKTAQVGKRPDPSLLGRSACAACRQHSSAPSSVAPRLRSFCDLLGVVLVSFFVGSTAFGVVSVQSSADRKEIGLTDTFTLSVVVSRINR